MDVPDQFQQIAFGIDEGGFVAILKQMTCPVMLPIEIGRVSGHKTPHECRQITLDTVEEKMEMIGQEGPR